MYDDATLTALAADLESDLVERKESLSSGTKDKIAATICAFSNDLPGHKRAGVIFVGLKDNGAPAGLKVDDRLLLDLAAIRSDGKILPLPVMTVGKFRFRDADLAVITVEPTSDPPVRYDGKICIRVGPRQERASPAEERILTERRRALDPFFDHRPVHGASLDDLDLNRIRLEYLPKAIASEVLAENHRSLSHQLAALHLVAPNGEPTYGAILLFGRDPRRWRPGAYIQFVRFDGTEITSPVLHQEEIDGPLVHVIRRIDDIILANIRIATKIGTHTVERRQPDYAVAALQQILRNAVLHRTYENTNAPVRWYWYSDRIEVNSPGGPYDQVTPENFGEPGITDYRNPALAVVMKDLGFIQKFGYGLQEARQACSKIDAPPPEFTFPSNTVVAILRTAALRGSCLILDPGASIRNLPPFETARRVPVGGSPDLDRRLRARPLDSAAWRIAMAQVEVAVHELVQESRGVLHVYPAAPYPLAAWMGGCLDRYARARAIILHQLVPGAERWIPLLPEDADAASNAPYFAPLEHVADHGEGKDVLFILEGATAQDLSEIVPLAAGVRWTYRLRPRPGATLDTAATGTSALTQLRTAVAQLRHQHSNANYHIAPSGPVALVVELARLLPATAVGSAIFYAYDPITAKHYPVIDISAPKLI